VLVSQIWLKTDLLVWNQEVYMKHQVELFYMQHIRT
jgi:argG: argininosuccinate synthase